MNDKVKVAMIGAVAVIAVTWMVMYNSPYQTCVRAAYQRDMQIHLEVMQRYSFASDEQRQSNPEYYTSPPPTEEAANRAQLNAEVNCAGAG